MATLEQVHTGLRFIAPARTLIGRSSVCDLRLSSARTSAEHASLRWTGLAWELRDLGSTNGTFIDDTRIAPGTPQVLVKGKVLRFADDERWLFSDASAPVPMAFSSSDPHAPLLGEDGLLALPSSDDPLVTVYFLSKEQTWVVDDNGACTPVADHDTLSVQDRAYTLRLPELAARTETPSTANTRTLQQCLFRFRVSLDEEHIQLSVQTADGQTIELGTRAHHPLLLQLARARLTDEQAKQVPDSARGWLYFDELTRALHIDEGRLNTEVFRARKQLASAGIENASQLIERRGDSRQLRFGSAKIDVQKI